MKIKWSEDAILDLHSLRHYIAQDNPSAAHKISQKILYLVELLSEHPLIGRPGRISETRELVISGTPYIIPYRIRKENIEILRVFHAAMQWPDIL